MYWCIGPMGAPYMLRLVECSCRGICAPTGFTTVTKSKGISDIIPMSTLHVILIASRDGITCWWPRKQFAYCAVQNLSEVVIYLRGSKASLLTFLASLIQHMRSGFAFYLS